MKPTNDFCLFEYYDAWGNKIKKMGIY